ncbi:FAD-binding protein [Sinomonas sp. ASV486]|uniref:FAD-binding protein n=1 Tax=Sinomonas sp. ASV486 TaxID=3051170 RepID=UPI0027DD1C90|nr:FAD-binding protein [Sinomonas sp. ASV486]MDQ4489810.1 FAD-binding protein [Sinomonas sp. ASV486]
MTEPSSVWISKPPALAGLAASSDHAVMDNEVPGFRGELLRPGDAGYPAARQIWNGAIERHPALIARCLGEEDAAAALEYAERRNLPLAVRGGGHNVSGSALAEGGLVIDFSASGRWPSNRAEGLSVSSPGHCGVTWTL